MIDSEQSHTPRVPRGGGSRVGHVLAGVLVVQVGTYQPAAMAAYPVPSVPTAAEPSQAPQRLRVTVDPLIEDASLISGWVMSRHPDLDDAASGASEEWIAVEITGATYDYRILVVAMRDGNAVGAAEIRSCECTNEALLDLVDGEIEAARGRLHARFREESPHSQMAPLHTRPLPPPSVRGAAVDRSLTWLGYTGVGTGLLGLGLMAAGFPLALRPDEIRFEGDEVQTRSTHGAGMGLAVIGGAAVVAGAAAIIFDAVRMRKRHLAVASAVGRRRVVVSLIWRF